jgi:hypothetical protein
VDDKKRLDKKLTNLNGQWMTYLKDVNVSLVELKVDPCSEVPMI